MVAQFYKYRDILKYIYHWLDGYILITKMYKLKIDVLLDNTEMCFENFMYVTIGTTALAFL